VVIESDAGITMDGVIFHMHDEHFWRTTDVEEVFPERKKERIETFTAEEVKRLDAGKKQHGGKYAGEKVGDRLLPLLLSSSFSTSFSSFRFVSWSFYLSISALPFPLILHFN